MIAPPPARLRRRPRFGRRRTVTGAVVAVLLLAGPTACTGGDEGRRDRPEGSGSSGAAAPASAPFRVEVTRVAGRLTRPQRAALARQVRGPLADYVDAAFLGGDYPRSGFGDSFGAFTQGATRRARGDAVLLTNARWGRTTESVRATRRTAYLSVVAPRRKPAGVTANVNLVFVVDRGDDPAVRVRLKGRLLLTRDARGRWVVFGYRLYRSDGVVRVATP